NLQLFETLAGELAKLDLEKQYIESISYSKENFPARPASVIVRLKDPTVELFSFYRDADRKYILDFWINADLLTEKDKTSTRPLPKLTPLPAIEKRPVVTKSPSDKNILTRKSKILPVVEVGEARGTVYNPGFRDVRYGASFIWDYAPMIP